MKIIPAAKFLLKKENIIVDKRKRERKEVIQETKKTISSSSGITQYFTVKKRINISIIKYALNNYS